MDPFDIDSLIQQSDFNTDSFPDLNLNNPMLNSYDNEDSTDFSYLFPDDDVSLKDTVKARNNEGDAALDLQYLALGSPSQWILSSEQNPLIEYDSELIQMLDAIPLNDVSNEQRAEIQNSPVLKTAAGADNGIHYQMVPRLFSKPYGIMSVKQQPTANKRLRYISDGDRFLPDSRYHPMSLQLPEFLKTIRLGSDEVLGVVATLVTIIGDGNHEMFVHANDLAYRVPLATKIGYASVFIPFDVNEIQALEKKFTRMSIIYKKCDEYSFDLIPFDTQTMFGTTEKYTSSNPRNTGVAALGKDLKRDYQLLSYKIVFQLAVQQDNVVNISNISCQTENIHDVAAQGSTNSNKRKASAFEDNDDSNSPASKQRRNNTGLPVC